MTLKFSSDPNFLRIIVLKTSSKTEIIVGLSMFLSRAKSENDEINSTLFIAIFMFFY